MRKRKKFRWTNIRKLICFCCFSSFSDTGSNDGKNHLVETLAALSQQEIVSEAKENAPCSRQCVPRRRSLDFIINVIDPAAVLIFIPHDMLVPRPLRAYPMDQQYDSPDSIITWPRNACRTVSCLLGLSPSAWYLALCLWHHYTTSFSQIKACRHSTDICLSALSVLNMFMRIVCQMDDSKVVKTTVSEGQAILEITITTSPTHPELFKALFGRLYCFKNTVTHPLVQGVHGVAVQNIDIREDAYGDIHLHAIVYPASRQQSVMRRAVMPRFVVRKFALRRSMVRRSTVRRSTRQRSIQALPDAFSNIIDDENTSENIVKNKKMDNDTSNEDNDDGHVHSNIAHTGFPIHSHSFSSLLQHNFSSDVINIEYDKTIMTSQEVNNGDACNVICQEASKDDDNNGESATINASKNACNVIWREASKDDDTINANKDHVATDLSTCPNANNERAYSSIVHTGVPIHSHSFSSLSQHDSSSDVINIEYEKTTVTSQEAKNDVDCNVICQEASEDDDNNGDSATISANKQDVTVDLSTCPNVNDGRAHSSIDHPDFHTHSHSLSSLVPHNSSSDVISLVTVMPARRAPLTKIHPKAMLQAASDPPPQIDHINGVTSHAGISLNVNGSVSSAMHDIVREEQPEIWTHNRYRESTTDPCKNDQGDMFVPKLCEDTYKHSCDVSVGTTPIFLSRMSCPQITQNPASTAMHHSLAVCICGLAFAVVLDPGRWSEKKLTLLLTNAAGVEKAILQKTKKENIDLGDLPAEVNTRFVSLPSGPPSVWLGTKHVIPSSIVSSSSHPGHLSSASSHMLRALRLALTLCHNIGAVIVSDTVVHAVMLTKTKQVALLSSCREEASMCTFNNLSVCVNYLQTKFKASMFQILPVYKYPSCLPTFYQTRKSSQAYAQTSIVIFFLLLYITVFTNHHYCFHV